MRRRKIKTQEENGVTQGEIRIAGAVSFVFTLGIYLTTLYRSVAGGDSGELVAEACQLGVAHPPGYPLYVVLNHVAINLFGGAVKPCVVANALSALFGAYTSGIITLSINQLAPMTNIYVSILTGIMYSFLPLVWNYTISSEVFSLNNALCITLIYSFITYMKYKNIAYMYLGAFISGLGLCNQHTMILFEVPLILVVLWTDFKMNKEELFPHIAKSSVAFVLGFFPYVLLFAAAKQRSTFGSWGDITTIAGLFKHFTRNEYGTFALSPMAGSTTASCLERCIAYFVDLSQQMNHYGLVFILIGIYKTARKHIFQILLMTWSFYLMVFHSLANLPLDQEMPYEVHRRFWMQPSLILILFYGVGCSFVLNHVKKYAMHVVVIMLSLHLGLTFNLPSHDSGSFAVGEFGMVILNHVPPNSMVLSHTDINWNTIRYYQICEQKRTDVLHISLQLMPYEWFGRKQRQFYPPQVQFPAVLRGTSTNRADEANAVYITRFIHANENYLDTGLFVDLHAVNENHLGDYNKYYNTKYHLVPEGLVFKVVLENNLILRDLKHLDTWRVATRGIINDIFQKIPKNFKFEKGSWEFAAVSIYYDCLMQRAIYLLSTAMSIQASSSNNSVSTSLLNAYYEVFYLYRRIMEMFEVANYATSKKSDSVKNYALASVKYMESLVGFKFTIQRNAESHLVERNYTDYSDEPVTAEFVAAIKNLAKRECIKAVDVFLRELPKDKDAAKFSKLSIALKKS